MAQSVEHRMKLLVVDDDRTSRKVYQREFRGGAYEILEASDGFEAIHMIHHQEIDLVVLDIEMPDMDGYQVCSWLRSEQFSRRFSKNDSLLPIIFVTSDESLESRLKGFRAGATEFVTKSFRPGELLKIVDRILKPQNVLAGLTALVIDDSALVRNMVRAMLLEQGMNVIEAEDGKEGYERLEANLDRVDMVITDLEMPEMKGDELCYRIRKNLGLKELPVIFLTAIPDRGVLINLFKAGANDYLVKPFVKEELIARLRVTRELLKNYGDEVAERKRMHHEVQRSRQLAEQSMDAAGKVEFTTAVLHNVNNVLNSVAVSGAQAERLVGNSRLSQLLMALRLIDKNRDRLTSFFNEDPKGMQLPEYFRIVSGLLETEHHQLIEELGELNKKVVLMKEIIEIQQKTALQERRRVVRSLSELVEEAIKINMAMIEKYQIVLERELSPELEVEIEEVEFVHVLINLIKNAIEAMSATPERVLRISSGVVADQVRLSLADSGQGVAPHHLQQMFKTGFTTKVNGHGFGLSYCARTIKRMSGRLEATSAGEGQGACFSLYLPQPHC